jgi:hypothetical protein
MAPAEQERTVASRSPSTGSILGGVALVGAAAGYAALALRFRNFNAANATAKARRSDRFAAGSAEFRAAEAFSREWERQQSNSSGWTASSSSGSRAGWSTGQSSSSGSQYSSAGSKQEQHGSSGGDGRTQQPGAPRVPSDGAPRWAMDELGLGATPPTYSQAKDAYHKLAIGCHPDSGGENADAEKFKRLTKAWTEVKQHLKRQ